MQFIINRPTTVNARYLSVYLGERVDASDMCDVLGDTNEYDSLEEFFEVYPSFRSDDTCYKNEIFLNIDIDTGQILNWPKGIMGDFNDIKVVDEGTYILLDDNCNIMQDETYRDYVPKCFSINSEGYGDYLEFNVDKNGYIENWKFTQKNFNKLMGIYED